jgi:hypothetical protein
MKWVVFICLMASATCLAADKPKVATFPLGGTSPQDLRDQIGFSIRTKLDRDGEYDPIAGVDMTDMAADAKAPVTFDTAPQAIKDLADGSGAVVLIWGDVSPSAGGDLLRLKRLDLRVKDAQTTEYTSTIAHVTDIRFAVEKFLEAIPGVTPFSHPNEQPVHHDPASDGLFSVNPNLVIDGDFATEGHWDALFKADTYQAPMSSDPPDTDRVEILRFEPGHNVLAMRMSLDTAQNNGLACLSDAIEIQPGVRYRVAFRYRSDGPSTHVFVKGYTLAKSLAGDPADREVYRLQIPPGPATNGEWRQVEADVNPRNPTYPVQRLRIDLYAYLGAGDVMFDDVTLKAVGRQSTPATEPAGQ